MDRDDLDELGPIDYLVVEFPGSRMTGEGLPLLVDLVDRGIIRILDLVFVKKELDGSISGLAIADLDQDGELDLAVFEGAASGLLDQDDLDQAGGVLEPGSSAGILVYENRWAAPFARALTARRCPDGGQRPDPGPGPARLAGRRRDIRYADKRGAAMPGLLRGVARTAVVAGTATAVSNRVSRRQANRWASQEPAARAAGLPEPPPAPEAATRRRHGHQAGPAQAARRAEDPGGAQRGRVRGQAPDSRHLSGGLAVSDRGAQPALGRDRPDDRDVQADHDRGPQRVVGEEGERRHGAASAGTIATARPQVRPRSRATQAAATPSPRSRWTQPQALRPKSNRYSRVGTMKSSSTIATRPIRTWNAPTMIITIAANMSRPIGQTSTASLSMVWYSRGD